MLRYLSIAGAMILAGAALYVRLAPSNPADWHVPLDFSENKDFKRGVQRVANAGADSLVRLDAILSSTPRVSVLSGSAAGGHVTYVVRSLVWGFPDYVTAQQDGNALKIYARSRFGRSDLGVNRGRVEQWLRLLEAR